MKVVKALAGMAASTKVEVSPDTMSKVARHYGVNETILKGGGLRFQAPGSPAHDFITVRTHGHHVEPAGVQSFVSYVLGHSDAAAQECLGELKTTDGRAFQQTQALIERQKAEIMARKLHGR